MFGEKVPSAGESGSDTLLTHEHKGQKHYRPCFGCPDASRNPVLANEVGGKQYVFVWGDKHQRLASGRNRMDSRQGKGLTPVFSIRSQRDFASRNVFGLRRHLPLAFAEIDKQFVGGMMPEPGIFLLKLFLGPLRVTPVSLSRAP